MIVSLLQYLLPVLYVQCYCTVRIGIQARIDLPTVRAGQKKVVWGLFSFQVVLGPGGLETNSRQNTPRDAITHIPVPSTFLSPFHPEPLLYSHHDRENDDDDAGHHRLFLSLVVRTRAKAVPGRRSSMFPISSRSISTSLLVGQPRLAATQLPPSGVRLERRDRAG